MTAPHEGHAATFAAKWVLVQQACGKIPTDAKNTHQGYSYTSEVGMKAIIGPALSEHGFAVYPKFEILRWDEGETKAGAANVLATVAIHLRVVDAETGWEEVFDGLGSGQDTQDKAVMKATTAAWKVAMTAALSISRGDDPEATDTEPTQTRRREPPKREPREISVAQKNRLWAITSKMVDDQLGEADGKRGATEAVLRHILKDFGLESSKDITTDIYDGIVQRAETFDVAILGAAETPFDREK